MSLLLKHPDVCSVTDVAALFFRTPDSNVCRSETNRSSTGALCIDVKLGFWVYAHSKSLPVGPRQRTLNDRNAGLMVELKSVGNARLCEAAKIVGIDDSTRDQQAPTLWG